MVEHRQPVCKLAFERMAEEPDVLYGEDIGSNYQGQETMLSKHFWSSAGHTRIGRTPYGASRCGPRYRNVTSRTFSCPSICINRRVSPKPKPPCGGAP